MAQQKCGIESFQKWQSERQSLESEKQFEKWMADKLQEKVTQKTYSDSKTQDVVTIPVVVHIIHRGEVIGTGVNLSEEQILSQIVVLNEDFRRQNNDQVNTPEVFQPVAVDTEIQFALARRDPEGLPTNGITRVNGGQTNWTIAENGFLKNLSYWPAEDYLNIWVTDLANPYLGYAQFPFSGLIGLEAASNNEYTDGVLIDYRVFGSEVIDPGADLITIYNLGRTTSHEVGHFLGLRHIWGDGDCSADDYCTDTPTTSTDHANLGEPCTFPGPNTCGSGEDDLPDMFQNYMDYTNDECMNLFTMDQKNRMMIILENSPRRTSLLSSKGALPPEQLTLDLGIRRIVQERDRNCSNVLQPVIEVRNYGTDPVQQATLSFYLDGQKFEEKTVSLDLDPLGMTQVAFESTTVTNDQQYDLEFRIESVNSGEDENTDNDSKSSVLDVLNELNRTFTVDFESGVPQNWRIDNRDDQFTWEVVTAPRQLNSNKALNINFYDYEVEGEYDLFISPVLDLTLASSATISFDVAYARYPGVSDEGMLITASVSCDDPVFESDTVYLKTGQELSTIETSQTSRFVPDGASEWRTEVVNLADYVGSKVRLAFIGINGFGNDLYIDNIRLDLGTSITLQAPALVSCDPAPELVFAVRNTLDESLNSFDIQLEVDDNIDVVTFDLAEPVEPGEQILVSAILPDIGTGYHHIKASILNTNGTGLRMPGESELEQYLYVDNTQENPPTRENFDSGENWLRVSSLGDSEWNTVSTNYDQSATINNSQINVPGRKDWIVSPVLDFSNLQQAYLIFDQAYNKVNDGKDILNVLVSTDCGKTYKQVIFAAEGGDLHQSAGLPTSASDWEREKIDLGALVGEPEVRIAFVNSNGGAGQVFLDNIEVFINDPQIFDNEALYPNPAPDGRFNLTLLLPVKQQVRVRIIDMQGRVILEDEFPNTLNQTYSFHLKNAGTGIYLVQVTGGSFSFVKRMVIKR